MKERPSDFLDILGVLCKLRKKCPQRDSTITQNSLGAVSSSMLEFTYVKNILFQIGTFVAFLT